MKKLNCGHCTVCCKNDLIFLKSVDDPTLYKTEDYYGNLILQHKNNGDCIYLDKGCTIYNDRPLVCRELDCRQVYKYLKRHPELIVDLQPDFMIAAKKSHKTFKMNNTD